MTDSPQKLKLEKIHDALIIRFYVIPSSPQLQRFSFFIKNTENNHSSASDWLGNTKSSFKENARTFSKNSTTQESIKILRLKEGCKTYTKKKTSKHKLKQ